MKHTIRGLRREAEMTQAQLAALLGCQQKDISRWELGKNAPKTKTLMALSGIFGVKIEDIVSPRIETNLEGYDEKRATIKQEQIKGMSKYGGFGDGYYKLSQRIPPEWYSLYSTEHLSDIIDIVGRAFEDGIKKGEEICIKEKTSVDN